MVLIPVRKNKLQAAWEGPFKVVKQLNEVNYVVELSNRAHHHRVYHVASLLCGQLAGVVEEYVVVDCRYPYEYAGGHIKGALNLYREEQLARWFLPDPLGTTPCPRSSVLIFHCEFSSERGPRLCRSLRRMDRDANRYPELWYPELYVLRGGYKEFYQHFQDLCEPQGYVHMRHKDFRAELRNYQRRKQPWSLRRIRKELFKPLCPGSPFP
ncbi:M-phase inducer phosphatase 3-like [Trachemys scripta elegans]|uniref:M-phase inducer phosphatase 3-like n=1 Tax=Trachemys scripta elegans TaxID=31138 RepID=UPI0015564601|nr:M-phase inducer phosphatase 3-like [Trachemys scripta elegans]